MYVTFKFSFSDLSKQAAHSPTHPENTSPSPNVHFVEDVKGSEEKEQSECPSDFRDINWGWKPRRKKALVLLCGSGKTMGDARGWLWRLKPESFSKSPEFLLGKKNPNKQKNPSD